MLLRGRAHAERLGVNGRQVLLRVNVPGDAIGDLCLLDQTPHSATVRCIQPSELLELPVEDFFEVLQDCPGLSVVLAQTMVARLRASNRRIALLARCTVQERVLAYLQDNAHLDASGARVIDAKVSRYELSRLVGASREVVSRVIQTLCASGSLELRGGHKRILVLKCDPT